MYYEGKIKPNKYFRAVPGYSPSGKIFQKQPPNLANESRTLIKEKSPKYLH